MTPHGNPDPRIPRWARMVLDRTTHPDDRSFVLGDADDEFRHRVASQGLKAAKRWYRRQAIT